MQLKEKKQIAAEKIHDKHAQNEEFKHSEIKQVITNVKKKVQTFDEHAMGCLIGALVGDSCGSLYQFSEKTLSEVEIDFCLTMPGGG